MDLSIIILSFNTKDITDRCLSRLQVSVDSCQKRLNNNIEIIVLDNGSVDGSAQMIKEKYPKAKLIIQKENTGFSKGNNIAVKQAKYPYLLLLNSDCYANQDSLYKALAYFRVNKNCDALGARLNYSTGKLQPSAGNLPNPISIIFWILGLSLVPLLNQVTAPFHPKDKKFFSKAHRVGWVMGAFFLIKKEIYQKVGGFDEKLFMHMEEVELMKRIQDQKYKIWYVPQVEVVHLHGASTDFNLGPSFLNELKGIKYFLKKHYSLFYFPVKLILMIGLILRIIVFSILGKSQRARIYMEGLKVV